MTRRWWRSLFYPLMGTLKPHSNGPLYSKTVIGTLAVDGWAVTFGTARRVLGWAAAHPSTASVPTSYYSMRHYNFLCPVKGYNVQACSVTKCMWPKTGKPAAVIAILRHINVTEVVGLVQRKSRRKWVCCMPAFLLKLQTTVVDNSDTLFPLHS